MKVPTSRACTIAAVRLDKFVMSLPSWMKPARSSSRIFCGTFASTLKHLSATGSFQITCCARYTTLKPPSPMIDSTRYFSAITVPMMPRASWSCWGMTVGMVLRFSETRRISGGSVAPDPSIHLRPKLGQFASAPDQDSRLSEPPEKCRNAFERRRLTGPRGHRPNGVWNRGAPARSSSRSPASPLVTTRCRMSSSPSR